MTNPSTDKPKPPMPSARLTAALAAAMLGVGIAVGGAVGPAPSPSLADSSTSLLLQALVRSAAQRAAQASTSAAATSLSPVATAVVKRRKHKRKHASSASSAEPVSTGPSGNVTEKSAHSKSAPNTVAAKEKASTLPPVTHIWLIELTGSNFSEVTAHTSVAPYLSSAMPQGTLLADWSALQASAFANDAASIAGSSSHLLDTIVQSPCPEGAAGANCTPNSTGALSTADEFLKTTLPSITSTATYKENGLVVITFASITNAAETGLPAGAATATLTSTPQTGALLISPFVTAGAESKATFNPTSPKQSLEHLLRR